MVDKTLLISDFDFLLQIGTSYGITPKTDDSRYKTWHNMHTGEIPKAHTGSMWFASINRCVTKEGDPIEGFFFSSYLAPYDYVIQDTYWERNEYGQPVTNKAITHFDKYDLLPRIFSFKKDHVGISYYLFEQWVGPNGEHEIFLLQHDDPTRSPGININNKERRQESRQWLEDLFAAPLVTKANRVLVYQELTPYPHSFLQSLMPSL